MTFRRLLSAGLLLSGMGCAALPGQTYDDVCINANASTGAEGGCGLNYPDASAEGGAVVWDGGVDVGQKTMTRSDLCAGSCSTPDNPLACVGDGGTTTTDAALDSCRVVLGAGQQTSAACAESGLGGDGASCTSGADCAPGYECVGTGTCRHYCCADSACTTLSANQYDTYFCDIATEHAASGAVVPVCQIVKSCQIFGGDQCGSGEQCTIVEINDGKTFIASCDTTGEAAAGESCETRHCGAGYACIGAIGQRTCDQLCDDTHPCFGGLTCNRKSPALAPFNGVGICQ